MGRLDSGFAGRENIRSGGGLGKGGGDRGIHGTEKGEKASFHSFN